MSCLLQRATKHLFIGGTLFVAVNFAGSVANAASLDVLWYGQNSVYNTSINQLAVAAPTYDPEGDGSLDWDLTIWNPGDPTPDFSAFDVFVIGSSGRSWGTGFEPSRLFNNKTAIEAARGNRTLLSGQDADAHFRNNPGPIPDGPLGFLVNAVNWAGSGTGTGIVALPDGCSSQAAPSCSNSEWWLHENSFLKNELEGYVSYFEENNVVIPATTVDFPVNEGLTTAGLSNWITSSHIGFNKDIPGYLSINDAGGRPGFSVTIVTASEAGGGTSGTSVPEPSTLLGLGALALASGTLLRRRRKV